MLFDFQKFSNDFSLKVIIVGIGILILVTVLDIALGKKKEDDAPVIWKDKKPVIKTKNDFYCIEIKINDYKSKKIFISKEKFDMQEEKIKIKYIEGGFLGYIYFLKII